MHQLYQKSIKSNINTKTTIKLSIQSIKKCLPEGQHTVHH